MALVIKTQFRDEVIGFNNSSLPLSKRTDTYKLYEMAKENNILHLLDMFEEGVTDEDIMEAKLAAFKSKQAEKSKQ